MKKMLSALLGSALCLSFLATPVQAVSNFRIGQTFQYYTYWEYKNTKADLVMSSNTAYHNHMSLFAIEKSSIIETAVLPQIGVEWLYSFKSNPNLTTITLPSDYNLNLLQLASNPNLTALLVPGNSSFDSSNTKWFTNTVTNRASDCPNLVVYGVPGTGAEWFASQFSVPFQDIATYGTATVPEVEPEFPAWALMQIEAMCYIMPDISVYNCEESATRGIIAQTIFEYGGNGSWPSQDSPFTDGGAYSTAISWCNEHNLMNGNSDTWFNADGVVTREQFALILSNLAQFQGKTGETGDVSALADFGDAQDISDWATGGMAWVVANGLMAGNNGNLNPKGEITRTEVLVMMYSFSNM